MDQEQIIKKARDFVRQAEKEITLHAVYVFGSTASGTTHKYSDIDVALFTENVPPSERLALLIRLYRMADTIDPRIEPHLFSLDSSQNRFAEIIRETGIRIA